MGLFEIQKPLQTIEEKIKQRRLQMLVHSYIYYELDNNIVSDSTWSKWAKELADLQVKYPKESKKVIYYEQFKDWTGDSGAFLEYDNFIKEKVKYLLKLEDKI